MSIHAPRQFVFDAEGTDVRLPPGCGLDIIVQFYDRDTGLTLEVGTRRATVGVLEFIQMRYEQRSHGYPGAPAPGDERGDWEIIPLDLTGKNIRGVVLW